MGSAAVAASIAHLAFWMLQAYGCAVGELSARAAGLFSGLWLVGLFGLPYVTYPSVQAMFSSFVAILDIALVFAVFKGDVRLT
jgi:hypothetical protein